MRGLGNLIRTIALLPRPRIGFFQLAERGAAAAAHHHLGGPRFKTDYPGVEIQLPPSMDPPAGMVGKDDQWFNFARQDGL